MQIYARKSFAVGKKFATVIAIFQKKLADKITKIRTRFIVNDKQICSPLCLFIALLSL